MSGALTPLLVPPPQPATKTDAIADNILRVIGYLLQNMRCKRIVASEKFLSLKTKIRLQFMQISDLGNKSNTQSK
jgi:hypothetical protein